MKNLPVCLFYSHSLTLPDTTRIAVSCELDDAALRRSSRTRRGNGGQLGQLRRIEEIQTTRAPRVSPMDLATQGDAVNPMAPAAQAVAPKFSSVPKPTVKNAHVPRNRLEASGNVHDSPRQQGSVTSNLRPTFSPAHEGSQFGFRLPNGSVIGQASAAARTPVRGTASNRSSRSISTVPSSRSVSTTAQSTLSTAPTSRTSGSGSHSHLPYAVVKRIPPTQTSMTSQAGRVHVRNGQGMIPSQLFFPPNG